jgi:hypothetical protein
LFFIPQEVLESCERFSRGKALVSSATRSSYALIGYHLRRTEYEEVAPDAEGKIFSPVTGLSLAVREGWLRWLTAEGEVVPTPQELAEQAQQQAEQERQRAEQERQQAEQERQRAERAEQLLEAYQRRFGRLE